jgi:acyl-coenzyme A synthetase/AMP-(fatty) acid ligase
MDFFNLLREHARIRTETVAVASPRRSMTYRKLWSRIERATARLQQEWKVGRGDIVAYCGNSHPDALVLYFSLARSGARLLPFPVPLPPSEVALVTKEFHIALLLADDDLSLDSKVPGMSVKPLSSLIATRCPREPVEVIEDSHHPALLWRQARTAESEAYSLAQLWAARTGTPPVHRVSVDALLDPRVLSCTVLPVLQGGGCIVLP